MMDAGAEWHNYAGDISRTFPVNGKFSAAQKAVYEVVLGVNKAVISAVKSGVLYADLHKLSEKLLTLRTYSLRHSLKSIARSERLCNHFLTLI